MMQRKYHLDILRVFSIIAVIILHAAGRCTRYGTPYQMDWQICQAIISLFSWAVPVFVMISGALFLTPEKEISLKILYGKYILRLAASYLFWSCVYTVIFSTLPYYRLFSLSGIWNTITGTLKGGSAHLWFMWMILGLYILLPVIRACIKNISDTVLVYWLIIGFIIYSVIPLVLNFQSANSIFREDIDILRRSMFGEYIFYFVLGYTIEHKKDIYNKKKCLIYAFGGISVIITIVITAIQSIYFTDCGYFLLANHSPTMVFISIALFVGFKQYNASQNVQNRCHLWLTQLSPYVFGIYLVHNLFLDSAGIKIIESLVPSIPLVIIMVILIILTCMLSFVFVWMIRLVKPLAKYIT